MELASAEICQQASKLILQSFSIGSPIDRLVAARLMLAHNAFSDIPTEYWAERVACYVKELQEHNKPAATVALSGHRDNGGVQNHSCGELFPWTVRVYEGDSTYCQAFNRATGEFGTRFLYGSSLRTFAEAHQLAELDAESRLCHPMFGS